MPTIWIDADACPKPVKDIVFRASARTQTAVVLVANQYIPKPTSALIRAVQVEKGFDKADDYIVQSSQAGDLIVTQDIPLAAECMDKGVIAIHPRGALYNKDTIKQKLAMRDFLDTMRSSGEHTGGPAAYNDKDKQQFANALDRWLAKIKSS